MSQLYSFFRWTFAAGLCLILMAASALSIWGLPSPTLAADAKDFKCAKAVIAEGNTLLLEYEDFLSNYLSADRPSSNLLELASIYKRQMEDEIRLLFDENFDTEAALTLEQASKEVSTCQVVRDEYLDYMDFVFSLHTKGVADAKQTVSFVDGLTEMNDGLSELHDDFKLVFPEEFRRFQNAFPCYARGCL